MWRCWLSALWLALSGIGCNKEESRAPVPPPVEAPPALPDIADLEREGDAEPDPPPSQQPLAADPLALEEGLAGTVDLSAEGLPAISEDGKRVAVVQRAIVDGTDQQKLALRIYGVDGDLLDQVVVVEPKAGGGIPAAPELERAVARANKLLAHHSWRSLIVPEQLLPDGWIRCTDGSQTFEVAGITVHYDEPSLRVSRGDEVLVEREMKTWLARPAKAGCNARGFIVGAGLDLAGSALMVVVDYCGECGVPAVRQVIGFR